MSSTVSNWRQIAPATVPAALVIAASLALADAGIHMYDLLAAATVVSCPVNMSCYCSHVQIDGDASTTVAYMPHLDQISSVLSGSTPSVDAASTSAQRYATVTQTATKWCARYAKTMAKVLENAVKNA